VFVILDRVTASSQCAPKKLNLVYLCPIDHEDAT
jgi:hypothetical protein